MKISSCKAKVYVCCDCEREFNNRFAHNAHKRHCGKAKGWIDGHGYKKIFVDGKEVREHRHIMEQYLGRKLSPSEHIHHLNNIKTDNRIENMELIDIKTHGSISGKLARGIPKPTMIGNKNGRKNSC